jgi:glycosidase
MLDAQFDFNHYDAMISAIALDGSWSDLVGIAEESLKAYGAHHLMGNLTGNQDRPRFTSLADGSVKADEDTKLAGWTRDIQHAGSIGFQRMQLLTAYLMSVPGIPCIYQGDEIADVGGNDPDNRRMMRFDALSQDEESTRSHAAEWIELRRARMSLLYGSTRFEVVSPALLRITRTYIGETTTVYLNKSSNPERIDIESTFTLLAGDAIVNGSTLTVPAMSAVAVTPSGRPL